MIRPRIWFDLSNSPHIHLFSPLIRSLEGEMEVIITSRPLANTVALLDLHGFRHTVVGRHYGKGLLAKASGYPVRVNDLRLFLKGRGVDVAVSHSSFHSPLVARLVGARSLYLNDNEHALGNLPSFAFADVIMVPECFAERSLRRQGARLGKVIRYPGVKEGIYLSALAPELEAARAGRRAGPRPRIYCRPEPATAQYYRGGDHVLDDLIAGLLPHADVTVLARGVDQAGHYRDGRFDGATVVEGALDLTRIVSDCDLFIGAGGTMTREMAVLGIPTVSVYRDQLLAVDRYLIDVGCLVHQPGLSVTEAVSRALAGPSRSARGVLEEGRRAAALLEGTVRGMCGREARSA